MHRRVLCAVALWSVTAALLAGCGATATPTGSPTGRVSPTKPVPSATPSPTATTAPCPPTGPVARSLATPQPADVLLQLAWEGGLTRPELSFAFGRVPEFTLLPDGSALYVDAGEPSIFARSQAMIAHLTPAETGALVQRVLDLGFERLESYTDFCHPAPDGTCLCVADAGESVLRLRLPSGELREIRNYYEFANDPDALKAIRTLLEDYRHAEAEPYIPEWATLFIQPVPAPSDVPVLDWPLEPAWLPSLDTMDAPCQGVLAENDVQTLLAVIGRNMGDFFFRHADQVYQVYLVPWLPGADYTDEIASYGQPCPPAEMATATGKPTPSSPCPQPTTAQTRSRLIVEEHRLKLAPTIAEEEGPEFQTADGDQLEILAEHQAYRDAKGLTLLSNNALLQTFGYRLEMETCAGPGRPWYHNLYRDHQLYLDRIVEFSPVSVNASATDFVMSLRTSDREELSYLLTKDGLVRQEPSYTLPIHVGDELLAIAVPETISGTIEVTLGDRLVYQIPVNPECVMPPPVAPGSPWVYDLHWVVEAVEGIEGAEGCTGKGHVVQDGQDLNETCGYEESFNFALLDGRPFYFYRAGDKIDISYDGQQIPTGYDEIPHYACCSAAALNPEGTQNMVWFFARRGEQWYYVEALVPLAEPPEMQCPPPTPYPMPTLEPVPTTAALPGTPPAGAARTRENDGMLMLYVPAGSFLMGSPEGEGEEDEHPRHPVTLDAFWIDLTEVTNAQYRNCVDAGFCRVPQCSWGMGEPTYDDPSKASHPVVCVSWYDASDYCSWVGARLPTEAEWELAARGREGYRYPWGNEFDGSMLSFCDLNCIDGPSDADADDGYARTAPVGSYAAGASPYGVLDMAGNVWEWVYDWYDASYYAQSPLWNPQGPYSGEARVIRGGCWWNDAAWVRSVTHLPNLPNWRTDGTGFRCAASATSAP